MGDLHAQPERRDIQFIGMIRTNNVSEIHGAANSKEGTIDPGFIAQFARAHEENGFDRILIGYHTTAPDGWALASHAAAHTEKLHVLMAHRPGFVSPTVAARKAVTIDHLSGGRFSFNIVTGGSDEDQARDGDWTTKEQRYRRTNEFLDIVRQVWSSDVPFDYDGEFYKVRNAFSEAIYFGGASSAAVPVGAKHADVYMLWGEPIAAVKERIAAVRAAAPAGRSPEFSVSFRPIIASTEAKAWEKARNYLDLILRNQAPGYLPGSSTRPGATGSQRLLEFAAEKEIHDKRLWTPIAAATGAGGNTTALVGTPEQVAEAILDYYDAGVNNILIRGFLPLEDAIEYGREIIPIVRQEVARRNQALQTASAAD
jgi:alkanesulfonate monooxygenase